MEPILTLSHDPQPEAAQAFSDGLDAYNRATIGYVDAAPLHILVTDPETGALLGGVSGRTSYGTLFVNLVYLPDALRGQDIGSRMLAMAEAEARRRGCRTGILNTISFQAPDFYQRLGWRVFGEIPGDPDGVARVFLTKDLS